MFDKFKDENYELTKEEVSEVVLMDWLTIGIKTYGNLPVWNWIDNLNCPIARLKTRQLFIDVGGQVPEQEGNLI